MQMMIICGAVYEIWHQTRVDYIQTTIICGAVYEFWHQTRVDYNTNKDYLWRGICGVWHSTRFDLTLNLDCNDSVIMNGNCE